MTKTLILNGSPRINGDTAGLIGKMTGRIGGEYKIVDAYRCSVSPCLDCRYCWENSGCAIRDEMQEIYEYIQECDNILIASPIYFSELTGRLLDVGSRLQTYFCARFFRKEEPILKPKKGAVILVGGGDGHMEKAYGTACTLCAPGGRAIWRISLPMLLWRAWERWRAGSIMNPSRFPGRF